MAMVFILPPRMPSNPVPILLTSTNHPNQFPTFREYFPILNSVLNFFSYSAQLLTKTTLASLQVIHASKSDSPFATALLVMGKQPLSPMAFLIHWISSRNSKKNGW